MLGAVLTQFDFLASLVEGPGSLGTKMLCNKSETTILLVIGCESAILVGH